MFRLCHSAPRTIYPFVFLWLSALYSIGGAPTNHGSEVGKSSRAKGTTFNIEMRLRPLRRHTNTVTWNCHGKRGRSNIPLVPVVPRSSSTVLCTHICSQLYIT